MIVISSLCFSSFNFNDYDIQAQDLSMPSITAEENGTEETLGGGIDITANSNADHSREDLQGEEEADEMSSLDLRANLELRKDLLIEPNFVAVNVEEDELYKTDPLVVEVQEAGGDLESQRHQRCPSYVTLTTVPSAGFDQGTEEQSSSMAVDHSNSGVSNITNLLNFSSSWVSAHEENGAFIAGISQHPHHPSTTSMSYYQRNNPLEISVQEFPHHSHYALADDASPFNKSSMPLGPNPLYHLDTSNRRIWVPESSRGGTGERSGLASRSVTITVPDAEVFMAAELENDTLMQQHVVNIQRFPNRCWRSGERSNNGLNPSVSNRTQYEKGLYKTFCSYLRLI